MSNIVAVIPTFNRKAHLAQMLRDLMAQSLGQKASRTGPAESDVQDPIGRLPNWFRIGEQTLPSPKDRLQIVVVNDGCTDGTLEMLENEFPQVHVVSGTGDWWYTRSMNEGFEKAYELNADYVLTMNDDVRLPTDYVMKLVNATRAEEGLCVMGSISVTENAPHRVTFSGVKDIQWWRFKYTHYLPHYSPVDLRQMKGVKDSKVLPGRGMLIPIAVLKSLGGFDADLVQYGSDDDFCLRAAEKEVKIKVCYEAVVYSYDTLTGVGNPSRKDSLKDVIKAFGNRYSTLYLPKSIKAIRRHGNRLLLPLTVLIVIAGSIKSNLKMRSA